MSKNRLILIGALIVFATALFGFGIALPPRALAQTQSEGTEQNPPGDIPDSQVFVTYVSPLGFTLKVPEGWARSERADGARFADKYGSVDVFLADGPNAPTTKSVKANEAATLIKTGNAVKISAIKPVKLPAGNAVLIVYASDSAPNVVTNKRIRLENNRYLLFRAGRLAALDLSAPAGADNFDQWKLMAESFRWK